MKIINLSDVKKLFYIQRNKEKFYKTDYLVILFYPPAIIFTWLFLKLKFSPNQTTLLSWFFILSGTISYMFVPPQLRWISLTLIIFWVILDYVDGGIARFLNQQTKYGDFIDVLGAYFLHAFLPICLGISLSIYPEYSLIPLLNVFSIESRFLPKLLLIFGAFASLSNILLRLIAMRMQITFNSNPREKGALPGNSSQVSLFISYIDSTISPRGLYFPFLIIATFFSILEWFILIYLIIYLLALFVYTGWYTFSLRK